MGCKKKDTAFARRRRAFSALALAALLSLSSCSAYPPDWEETVATMGDVAEDAARMHLEESGLEVSHPLHAELNIGSPKAKNGMPTCSYLVSACCSDGKSAGLVYVFVTVVEKADDEMTARIDDMDAGSLDIDEGRA